MLNCWRPRDISKKSEASDRICPSSFPILGPVMPPIVFFSRRPIGIALRAKRCVCSRARVHTRALLNLNPRPARASNVALLDSNPLPARDSTRKFSSSLPAALGHPHHPQIEDGE
jgi:hypothetical protein